MRYILYLVAPVLLILKKSTLGSSVCSLSVEIHLTAPGCDFPQVARDVDGSGNYFILTHKHVAQIHPLSGYGAKSPKLGLPEWVLFHEHSFSEDNCLRTVTHITPEQ